MTVVLQPQAETVGIRRRPQSADIIRRHVIGNQSAQVPEKSITLIRTSYHPPRQHRQPRQRIVATLLAEYFLEPIRPILRTHFVTVRDNVLESLAIRRRHALEQLADERVEVRLRQLPVHFVHLKTLSLGRGR